MMRCLEVRHSLNTEPANKAAEIVNHLKRCPECSQYVAQVDQFESKLANTLKVDVPEGLAYRILLTQNITSQRANKMARRRFYGIAASVMFTLTLVAGLIYFNQPYSLDQVALLHVKNEQYHLNDRDNVQLAALNRILSPLNLKLSNSIGTINYAGACKIRNNRGGHIVLQGKNAPITLLLMPGEYVAQKETVKGDKFKGIILPIENGSIALIGEDEKELEPLLNKITQSLRVIS
jgi:hypothetical protein